MNGSRTVRTLSSIVRPLPTVRLAATWPRTWASHPPRAASMANVEQFSGRQVDAAAGEVVAGAVGRQELLEVRLVLGGRRVHVPHPGRADNLFLYRPALFGASGRGGGGLPVKRRLDAALGQDVVGGVDEVEHLAHTHVGDGLVDDLPGLDRADPDGEGGAEHDPVLAERLDTDEGRQRHHEPGPGIQAAVLEHLIEGEVVEDLDQLRVGDLQSRYVAGKQLVVVPPLGADPVAASGRSAQILRYGCLRSPRLPQQLRHGLWDKRPNPSARQVLDLARD